MRKCVYFNMNVWATVTAKFWQVALALDAFLRALHAFLPTEWRNPRFSKEKTAFPEPLSLNDSLEKAIILFFNQLPSLENFKYIV